MIFSIIFLHSILIHFERGKKSLYSAADLCTKINDVFVESLVGAGNVVKMAVMVSNNDNSNGNTNFPPLGYPSRHAARMFL